MDHGQRPAMDNTLTSVSSANGQRDRTQEWLDGHPCSSSGVNETLNDNDDGDQDFATRLYSLCLRILLFLCQREQNVPSKRSKVANLKEELGKLYLWGEAFRNGKLDRALEYSNDVRGNVLDSLGDIGKILLRDLWPSSISELAGGPLQKSIYELKFLVEQAKDITSTRDHAAPLNDSDWADESDTDGEDSSDDDDTTNIVDELRLQTQWLTQLGPILEQNLVSAQKPRIQASLPATVPFSVSGPAKVYVALVREKYKLAQDRLVERLGEANWQRHISVRKSMEASANVVEETTAPVESSAVAQSVFRPYSTFHDSALGPSIPEQTEYADTLPAIKPHASGQSDHEEVEHITGEYDSSGEAKTSPVGELLGGRVFRIRTFVIPSRSKKHLMLATECARVLGYRDSYLLFKKNPPLLRILATKQDKDDLIDQDILPYSHRSRQIALVTAKSIFRQFGARVIEGGRRVRDDYWEADAVRRGSTEEDMPGQIPMSSAKAAGVAGQAEHSQGGPAQPSASFSRKLDTDLFRERQPSPGKEGRDSRAREATPFGTIGNLGRVDALGPPSQDYPMPAPPLWLSQALGRLQQTYPDDLLEATMRYEAVSTISDLPQRLAPNEPVPPDTKFMYYPRIKCLDCPGKMYLPGPGGTVDSFENHLKNRLHREKVGRRRKLVLPNAQEPTPIPQIVIPRPSKPRQERLNEFFVSGEGIHHEVLQREIRNYLGPEAHSRPATYNGNSGYFITTIRPFSSKMLDNLIELSKLYAAENPEIRKRGQDIAYGESETGRHQELRAGAEDNATASCYWSVAEQNDFYNLVLYFGTDWQAIAATMKTKTAGMVNNFYNHKIQEGESGQQLEENATRVDAMIADRVDMGPLPVPTSTERWEDTTRPMVLNDFGDQFTPLDLSGLRRQYKHI